MPSDFPAAFAELREILRKHSGGMTIQVDKPGDFTVITRSIGPNKRPIWFGAVLLKKSAVTYHLFPLYFNPKLQATIPAGLLPRKQGKTCFNFQRPDSALFPQLDSLTQRGRECFERAGLLNPGPVAAETLDRALRAGGEDPRAIAKLRKAKGKAAAAKRTATLKNKAGKQNAGKAK